MEDKVLDNYQPVFEVSQYAPKILKDIEKIFAKLKKKPFDVYLRKQLVKKIKTFTGIKKVSLSIKKKFFNASVIPIYDDDFIKMSFEELKGININQQIKPTKLQRLSSIEESSKYIKKIYLILGAPLFKQFSPEELTSILLHEIGHAYLTTSNVTTNLIYILKETELSKKKDWKKIKKNESFFPKVNKFFNYIFSIQVLHGLTFLERMHEYKSDKFAVKYGYGVELISVHKFFDSIGKRKKSNSNILSIIKQKTNELWNIIINPEDYSHPAEKKRIAQIERQIKNKCIDVYPNLSTELSIILKDYEYA